MSNSSNTYWSGGKKIKMCRECGRTYASKPGSPRSKKCACGGKLVSDPIAADNAKQQALRIEKRAIQDEIVQIDKQINELQATVAVEEAKEVNAVG